MLAQAWLPDSPRWLLLNGDGDAKAEAALVRARGKYGGDLGMVRAEVAAMARSVREAQQEPEVGEGTSLSFCRFPLQRLSEFFRKKLWYWWQKTQNTRE